MAGGEPFSIQDDERRAARERFRHDGANDAPVVYGPATAEIDPGRYESSSELSRTVVRASQGDEDAITELYRHFNPALLRFLKGRVPSAAEDVASEVWVSVAKGLAAFQGDDRDFRAWLFATARRRSIDHLRRIGRRPRIKQMESSEELAALVSEPSHAGEQLEVDEAVRELVAGLSQEQAEILLLRVVAGLSSEEVAQIVGKSEGTVRVIQHRAIKRLAEKFRKGM
ncbi:MAG: RNA polymerase sigma factor [Actinomycetota bacterium]|nr:RNA polymerase sigma factor [Actinomycetota bacterium]